MKLMILGRRARGITRAACHAHLRHVHGQMVVDPPKDAGAMPDGYVQNHVLDAALFASEGRHAIGRDLVTELWFADVAALRAATATPYYLGSLRPDEPNFVDDATVEKLPVRPRGVVEGPMDGPWKVFVVLGPAGAPPDGLAALRECGGLAALVENAVLPGPDGGPPFADVILEGWFARRADAEGAVDALASVVRGAAGRGGDATGSAVFLAEQFDTPRLLRIGPVPGSVAAARARA